MDSTTEVNTKNNEVDYRPYHFVVQKALFHIRWTLLARPFHTKAMPKWFLFALKVPGLKFLPYLSLGQIILMAPLISLLVAGLKYTFTDPDGGKSGYAAWYCIVTTFLLANKSTSVLSFFFGLSWERVVPFHYISAVLSVFLAILHGYVVFAINTDNSEDELALDMTAAMNEDFDSSFNRTYDLSVNQTDSPRKPHHHYEGNKYKNKTYDGTYVDGFGNRDLGIVNDNSVYNTSGPMTNLWKYMWDGWVNISGTIMIICMSYLILLSASRWFRKHNFDLWLFLHIVFSTGVVAFAIVHSISTMKIIIVWWAIDLLVRYVAMTKCLHPQSAQMKKLLPDLVEIRFKRNKFHFEAGQFVRISIPEIGIMQFHPVTISSAPFENEVTLHFRIMGDWTKRLSALAEHKSDIDIQLEGPYGSLTMELEDAKRYPVVVLVCGGIGVTPMMSLARQIMHEHQHMKKKKRRKVHLIWSVHDMILPEALPLMTTITPQNPDDKGIDVESSLPSRMQSNKKQITATTTNSTEFFDGSSRFEAMNTTNKKPKDDMQEEENDTVFQADIYITKEDTDESTNHVVCDVDDNVFFHRGRPNIPVILKDLAKEHIPTNFSNRIALIACGPTSLVNEARQSAMELSKVPSIATTFGGARDGIVFDFHDEIFEY